MGGVKSSLGEKNKVPKPKRLVESRKRRIGHNGELHLMQIDWNKDGLRIW